MRFGVLATVVAITTPAVADPADRLELTGFLGVEDFPAMRRGITELATLDTLRLRHHARAQVLDRMAPIESSLPDVWPHVLAVVESYCVAGVLRRD